VRGVNLYGTGRMEGMESEYIDTYVNSSKEYHGVHEEFWKFVVQRYGGQEIVRKWIPIDNYQNSKMTHLEKEL